MTAIHNSSGALVARIVNEEIILEPDSADAAMLEGWIANGVPALRGVKKGNVIVEMETLVQQADPRYWMAFAEALDERGFKIIESP